MFVKVEILQSNENKILVTQGLADKIEMGRGGAVVSWEGEFVVNRYCSIESKGTYDALDVILTITSGIPVDLFPFYEMYLDSLGEYDIPF